MEYNVSNKLYTYYNYLHSIETNAGNRLKLLFYYRLSRLLV